MLKLRARGGQCVPHVSEWWPILENMFNWHRRPRFLPVVNKKDGGLIGMCKRGSMCCANINASVLISHKSFGRVIG